MNRYKNALLYIIGIIATVSVSSCEKRYIIKVSDNCSDCAAVKFLNADPDSVNAFQFFINDDKVTGNALDFGGTFPATSEYASIQASSNKVAAMIGENDSTFTAASDGSISLTAGKRYGLIFTGESGKDGFLLVENRSGMVDSSYIMAQFVNLIKRDQTVDVVAQSSGEVVFSAVPYKGVADYVKLVPTDTYIIKESGTDRVLYTGKLSVTDANNYTFYALGVKDDTAPSSAAHIVMDYYTNGHPAFN